MDPSQERSQAKALIEALEGGNKDMALRRRYNEALTEGNVSGVVRDVKMRLGGGAVFSEDDYNSGDGFQTFIWGPCVWTFLHIVSMNYRPERKEEYRAFLRALQPILPCRHCRENFGSNQQSAIERMLREKRIDDAEGIYRDRKTFSYFVWALHHEVNVMLKKDLTNEPTFDETRATMETFRSRCLTDKEIEKRKAEAGCVDPVHGADAKARCQILFVPRNEKSETTVEQYAVSPECTVRHRNKVKK